MSEQARRAYEAYTKALGAERLFAPWDVIPERAQEAWREAVKAAIDSPPRPESLTDKQVRLLEEMDTAKLARMLKAAMPPDRAFILFTAQYGDRGNLAYVATMHRDDAVRTVREWLKHQGAL